MCQFRFRQYCRCCGFHLISPFTYLVVFLTPLLDFSLLDILNMIYGGVGSVCVTSRVKKGVNLFAWKNKGMLLLKGRDIKGEIL